MSFLNGASLPAVEDGEGAKEPKQRPSTASLSTAVIVRHGQNLEALAAAMVLQKMLTKHLSHSPEDIPTILETGDALPPTTKKVILVCTNGVLEQKGMADILSEVASPKACP